MIAKTVLITSGHLWDWCFKGGIHFLTKFFINKGCRVAFLTIPFSIFTILHSYKTYRSKRVPLAMKSWLKNGKIEYGGNFISYVPFTLFHPGTGLPSFLNNNFMLNHFLDLSFPSLKQWLKRRNFDQPDILMVESGLPASISQIVKYEKMICRISDDPSDLGYPDSVIKLETDILKRSDIVLPVCKAIYDSTISRRGTDKGVYYLPNGVEIDIFQNRADNPPEYSNIPKPRAVYVGGLNGMVDFDLLSYTAERLPKVSFVIIGPYSKIPLKEIPKNIYFLGGRSYHQLPSYLQNADVGLIPFQQSKKFDKMERPIKFYQYVASGLPVVSVSIGGLKVMEPYAFLANSYEDFSMAIKDAINVDDKYKDDLRNIAQEFSWENIYSQFEKILSENNIHF